MENKENLYYHMPFYMTYPMQNLYLMEMEYEKDMERMKELYPKEVQNLQKMIEQRCDQMEYEGSRMYDENPDRFMLEAEIRRILEKFLRENPQYDTGRPPAPPMPRQGEVRPPAPPMPRAEELMTQNYGYEDNSWLRSLIGILFHDEMYRRRCRHRRCNRWW